MEYSFLTDASILEDSGFYSRPVEDWRTPGGDLDLDRCAAWAESQEDKARLQVLFERRLRSFEEGYQPE